MVRKGDLPSESHNPDDAEFIARLEALKGRIAKITGVEYTLQKLVKAGADEGKLLLLLALASQSAESNLTNETGRRNKSVADEIRKRKKELESMASQMEDLAAQTERLLNHPFTYSGFWLAVLGHNDDYQGWGTGKQHRNPLPTLMRSFAKTLRRGARNLQAAAGLVRMEERKYLSRLILYVREATGRTFDQQIATLLMDAFEANGQNRKFSPDQIKKHRQRYVPSSRARNSSS